MSKSLSIGTVAQMIGVSSEALRFYSKKGVFQPSHVDESGFRHYSSSTITHLFKARYLRSMGFSLPEVVDQNMKGIIGPQSILGLKGLSIGELMTKMEERKVLLKKEIEHIEKVLSKVEEYARQISEIQDLFGKYRIEYNQEMLYLNFSDENDEIDTSQKLIDEIKKWVNLFPISRYGFVCTEDMYRRKENNFKRGLIIPLREAELLHIRINGRLLQIRPKLCVHTIIREDYRRAASISMLGDAVEFLRDKGYAVDGDIFGMWMTNVQEASEVAKYYEVWIPVKL